MGKSCYNGSELHYNPPTHFNKDVHGQIWKMEAENKEIIFYIQTSKDSESPNWQRLGTVMEKAFTDLFPNDLFIKQCLKMYEYQSEHPLAELTKMFNI